MLTNEAFNALLKTLEEPPAHAVFVLATTEPHRIPATILSRCQRYDFRRVGLQELSDHLAHIAAESGIEATAGALRLIALQSDGGVRDAVSVLDQCSVMSDAGITEGVVRELLGLVGQEAVYALFAAVAKHDGAATLTVLEQQLRNGKDARQLLIELAGYCRSLMLFKAAPDMDSPVLASFSQERLQADSKILAHARLVQLIELFFQAAGDARWSVDPRITAEMALLTACTDAVAPVAATAAASQVAPASAKSAAAIGQKAPTAPVAPPIQPLPSVHTPLAGVAEADGIKAGLERKAQTPLETPELAKVMAELLKRVEQGGKRSIKALLEDAGMISCENGIITLLFQRAMIRERVEREDVRKWLELLLTQILSAPVRLQCVTEKPVPQSAAAKKAAPVPEAIPPEVLKVQQIFGGQITKLENKGGN